VIVSLHWGTTGMLIPDEAQRLLAHAIIEAGAVAILGHGPHSPQGVEIHRGGVIAYSLGNLFMDCRCTAETDALLLGFQLRTDGTLERAWLLPFQAGVASHAPSHAVDAELLDLVTDLSQQLGTTLRRQGPLLVAR
jgi:poly-gamma-glutamate synthesis protein (capsule biosynthesis protein)